MNVKKFKRAKRKFVKKNVKYFSIYDESGSGIFCNGKEIEWKIVDGSDGDFINVIMYLKNLEVSELFYVVLRMYKNMSYAFRWKFCFKLESNCKCVDPIDRRFNKILKERS